MVGGRYVRVTAMKAVPQDGSLLAKRTALRECRGPVHNQSEGLRRDRDVDGRDIEAAVVREHRGEPSRFHDDRYGACSCGACNCGTCSCGTYGCGTYGCDVGDAGQSTISGRNQLPQVDRPA
jgi:hypothetical protein